MNYLKHSIIINSIIQFLSDFVYEKVKHNEDVEAYQEYSKDHKKKRPNWRFWFIWLSSQPDQWAWHDTCQGSQAIIHEFLQTTIKFRDHRGIRNRNLWLTSENSCCYPVTACCKHVWKINEWNEMERFIGIAPWFYVYIALFKVIVFPLFSQGNTLWVLSIVIALS